MTITKRISTLLILLTPLINFPHTSKLTFHKAMQVAYQHNPLINSQRALIERAQGVTYYKYIRVEKAKFGSVKLGRSLRHILMSYMANARFGWAKSWLL